MTDHSADLSALAALLAGSLTTDPDVLATYSLDES